MGPGDIPGIIATHITANIIEVTGIVMDIHRITNIDTTVIPTRVNTLTLTDQNTAQRKKCVHLLAGKEKFEYE